MNEYKMTFNALNMAAKDLERKLPILAPFQTVDEQKQLVMLVSFYQALCSSQQELILQNSPQQPKFLLELGMMKRILG